MHQVINLFYDKVMNYLCMLCDIIQCLLVHNIPEVDVFKVAPLAVYTNQKHHHEFQNVITVDSPMLYK